LQKIRRLTTEFSLQVKAKTFSLRRKSDENDDETLMNNELGEKV
jgi:hypothetical protein